MHVAGVMDRTKEGRTKDRREGKKDRGGEVGYRELRSLKTFEDQTKFVDIDKFDLFYYFICNTLYEQKLEL